MQGGDRSVDLLKTLRGEKQAPGLRIVVVNTTEPEAITLLFEGTKLALDLDIFEVPVSCYPLRKGDRLLAFPLIGEGLSQRWGVVVKLNNGVTMATMQSASSLLIDGIAKVYGASDLIIPPYVPVSSAKTKYLDSDYYLLGTDIRPLQAGDQVSIAPTWDGTKIKYVILQRY